MTALDASALLQFHQQLISLCLCVVKSEEVLMFSYPHMMLFREGQKLQGRPADDHVKVKISYWV